MPTQKQKGSVIDQPAITISTLAALTGLVLNGPTMSRGGRILSISLHGGVEEGTALDPTLIYGIMSGDMSLAELEEYLELDGPTTPELVTESERATRGARIRVLGAVSVNSANAASVIAIQNRSMSGLKFAESGEGTSGGWKWFVYNTSNQNSMTTGAFFAAQAQLFVEWNPSG